MQRIALIVLVVASVCSGCGYGDVSPKTYQIATSLYNVSNRKLPEKLDTITQQIEVARDADEISAKEAKWLNSIVEKGKQEKWKQAMQAARRLMEDQVRE